METPAAYQSWLDKTYYSRECHARYRIVKQFVRILLDRGPIVGYQFLTLVKEADTKTDPNMYDTLWKRLVLLLISRWREETQPCLRLFQIHHWVKKNPQHIDWGVRYKGFSAPRFLQDVYGLVEECSRATCPVNARRELLHTIKSKQKCQLKEGCWQVGRCYRGKAFHLDGFYTEHRLLERAAMHAPSSLVDWMKRMVGDALMTEDAPKSLDSMKEKSKRHKHVGRKLGEAKIRQRLTTLQNYSDRLIALVTKIGSCAGSSSPRSPRSSPRSPRSSCKNDSKKAAKLVKEVEALNRSVIRCQAIHGNKTADVIGCLEMSDSAIKELGQSIVALENKTKGLSVPLSPQGEPKSPTKSGLKWIIREVLGLVASALSTLLSPWKWLWSKTVDSATRLGQWMRANILQTTLIVLVVAALSYGVITVGWAGVLLAMVKQTFFAMCHVFIWWCNLGFIKRTLFSLGLMTADVILRGYSKENEKTLKRIAMVKNAILFVVNLLTPLCFLYQMFGPTLKKTAEEATDKPCECECGDAPPTKGDGPGPGPGPGPKGATFGSKDQPGMSGHQSGQGKGQPSKDVGGKGLVPYQGPLVLSGDGSASGQCKAPDMCGLGDGPGPWHGVSNAGGAPHQGQAAMSKELVPYNPPTFVEQNIKGEPIQLVPVDADPTKVPQGVIGKQKLPFRTDQLPKPPSVKVLKVPKHAKMPTHTLVGEKGPLRNLYTNLNDVCENPAETLPVDIKEGAIPRVLKASETHTIDVPSVPKLNTLVHSVQHANGTPPDKIPPNVLKVMGLDPHKVPSTDDLNAGIGHLTEFAKNVQESIGNESGAMNPGDWASWWEAKRQAWDAQHVRFEDSEWGKWILQGKPEEEVGWKVYAKRFGKMLAPWAQYLDNTVGPMTSDNLMNLYTVNLSLNYFSMLHSIGGLSAFFAEHAIDPSTQAFILSQIPQYVSM